MRNTFLCIVLCAAMTSCNKPLEIVSPSNNQKTLGMVIQTPSAQNSGLILLKDGRAINPQSGFNPTQVSAGSKFVLSFEQLSTTGKVLNVNVTSFTSANDSTFVPKPVNTDSASFKAAMAGTHHCTFTSAVVDSAHPADTTKTVKYFDITVNGNAFESSASYAPVPGGVGIYYFTGNQINNLHFLNYASPALPNLLSGNYYYAVFDKYVAIWTYTNATYSGFLVTR